jgi:hypothetical protein
MKLRYPLIVLGSLFVSSMFAIGLNFTLEHILGRAHPALVAFVSLPIFFVVCNGLDKPFHDVK